MSSNRKLTRADAVINNGYTLEDIMHINTQYKIERVKVLAKMINDAGGITAFVSVPITPKLKKNLHKTAQSWELHIVFII